MNKKIIAIFLIVAIAKSVYSKEDLRAKYEEVKNYIQGNTKQEDLYQSYQEGKTSLAGKVDRNKYFSSDVKAELKDKYEIRKGNYVELEKEYGKNESDIDNFDVNDYSTRKSFLTNQKKELKNYMDNSDDTQYNEYNSKIEEIDSKEYSLDKNSKYISDIKGRYSQESIDKEKKEYTTPYKYTQDYATQYKNNGYSGEFDKWTSKVEVPTEFHNSVLKANQEFGEKMRVASGDFYDGTVLQERYDKVSKDMSDGMKKNDIQLDDGFLNMEADAQRINSENDVSHIAVTGRLIKASLVNLVNPEAKSLATSLFGNTTEDAVNGIKDLVGTTGALDFLEGNFSKKASAVWNTAKNTGSSVVSSLTSVPFVQGIKHRITSNYGYRIHPITGEKKFHGGVDLAGKIGDKISAVGDGTVSYAGWKNGYGNFIEITHSDGTKSRYGHLNAINVKSGQVVKSGSYIGQLGNTGKSTGPHLHFEIKDKNGNTVNPQKYI